MQVFQVVPPIARDFGNGLEIDVDFVDSLKVYLEYFESFAVACPILKSNLKGSGLEKCIPVDDLPWDKNRVKFIPLPTAYKLPVFMKEFARINRQLKAEIDASEYLIVTPHTLIGDWPTIAIMHAVKQGRPYTIEADGVHLDVASKRHISDVAWKRFVKRRILFPLFDKSYRYCLENSSLAVFQGKDVYDAYAEYCTNPHMLNHHVPVYAGDHITDAQLQAKLESIAGGKPLKICYAGRAIDMKGPLDWVETLHRLASRGVKFQATWLGDGPMLDDMKSKAAELNIPDLELVGFISDRDVVLSAIKQAHIFMFCHNTRESARILGEALACGAPLVGFESAYPVDLVAEHGGGLFCEIRDVECLAQNLLRLDANRAQLAELVTKAARSGREFDRDAALRRRAELVKQQRFSGAKRP